MDDELNLDLNEDNHEEIISRNKKKINSLSEKLGLSEKEKADLAKAKEEEALARQNAEKERDFYKGYSQVTTKYPAASEYQEKIFEKVKSGYDVEDATISILAKEGKYQPIVPPKEREMAAGGSAATGITDNAEKTFKDMSQSERLDVLKDLESRGELRL